MDNVILSDEQRVFEIGGTDDDYWRALCIAQARHLLKLFKEPCAEHPKLPRWDHGVVDCETCKEWVGHDCGFAEEACRRGWTWHDKQKPPSFYKHRRDCPKCLEQIEKEIEG